MNFYTVLKYHINELLYCFEISYKSFSVRNNDASFEMIISYGNSSKFDFLNSLFNISIQKRNYRKILQNDCFYMNSSIFDFSILISSMLM